MVGRGEETAVKILKELMPKSQIITQVPLYKLLIEEDRIGLSERQQKETIDIVVKRKHKLVLCVRIQDKHHNTRIFGNIDGVQKATLEHSHNEVVDIPENECPELFKEKLTDKSMQELKYYIKSYL